MRNSYIPDSELMKFCLWKKRIFRNDSTLCSFRVILKNYFFIRGSQADEIIKRIISLGYAESLEEEGDKEDDTPDTIIKILV